MKSENTEAVESENTEASSAKGKVMKLRKAGKKASPKAKATKATKAVKATKAQAKASRVAKKNAVKREKRDRSNLPEPEVGQVWKRRWDGAEVQVLSISGKGKNELAHCYKFDTDRFVNVHTSRFHLFYDFAGKGKTGKSAPEKLREALAEAA